MPPAWDRQRVNDPNDPINGVLLAEDFNSLIAYVKANHLPDVIDGGDSKS